MRACACLLWPRNTQFSARPHGGRLQPGAGNHSGMLGRVGAPAAASATALLPNRDGTSSSTEMHQLPLSRVSGDGVRGRETCTSSSEHTQGCSCSRAGPPQAASCCWRWSRRAAAAAMRMHVQASHTTHGQVQTAMVGRAIYVNRETHSPRQRPSGVMTQGHGQRCSNAYWHCRPSCCARPLSRLPNGRHARGAHKSRKQRTVAGRTVTKEIC